MPRGPVEKNSFEYVTYEGEECVRFTTAGKHKFFVIVDKTAWDGYLCNHTWSVSIDKKSGRASVKTSIANQDGICQGVFLQKITNLQKDTQNYRNYTSDSSVCQFLAF